MLSELHAVDPKARETRPVNDGRLAGCVSRALHMQQSEMQLTYNKLTKMTI